MFMRIFQPTEKGNQETMKRKPAHRTVDNRGRSRRSNNKKFIQPRSLGEFLAMPKSNQEIWDAIGQVTTEVRLGATLTQASIKFGVDRRLVSRLPRLPQAKQWAMGGKEIGSTLACTPSSKPRGANRHRSERFPASYCDRKVLECCRSLPQHGR